MSFYVGSRYFSLKAGLIAPLKRKPIHDATADEEDKGLLEPSSRLSAEREIEMRESSSSAAAEHRRRRKAGASSVLSATRAGEEGYASGAREISLKDVKRFFVIGLPGYSAPPCCYMCMQP